MTETTTRGLIVYADGQIDEIDNDGEVFTDSGNGVFEELQAAGYPLFGDSDVGQDCFDLSVDEQGQVTAYVVSEEPGDREQPMGAVTPKLAAWLTLTEVGR